MEEGDKKKKVPSTEEQTIVKLIGLIEKNSGLLFGFWDTTIAEPMSMVYFSVFALMIAIPFINKLNYAESVTLLVASLAVFVSCYTYIRLAKPDNLVDYNFKKLNRKCGGCIQSAEKPLLLALLKMKAKNQQVSLLYCYKRNREMFSEKKLIETLFE